MIELDGTYGEGGGALVRTALALSTLTGKAFHVQNIRAGREQGGLKAQHLTAIKALQELCSAKTNEIYLGSKELLFAPGKIKSGTYEVDIGTAGSISLLLQALILPALFAPSKVTLHLRGGTCGLGQASVDYLQNVLLPHLQTFAQKISLKILKRGYYPQGGGEVLLEISPKYKLKNYNNFLSFSEELNLKIPTMKMNEQGQLEQVRGVINVSRELADKEVGERIQKAAENYLRKLNVPINLRVDYVQSLDLGGEVNLWGLFSQDGQMNLNHPVILGASALLEKKKSSEEVGEEAARKLMEEISLQGAVDSHLLDQLIPFLAFLPGSEILAGKITTHTMTNIYVAEKFLEVGFKIEGRKITVERIKD